jgi:hypothetical protein
LIYNSENPRILKCYTKTELPVIWKSNKKAWITMKIFEEKDHFTPSIKDYLKRNNLSDTALLTLYNAPGHPTILDNLVPNICVVFLPPNTTALLQPMDQEVIATFKVYYLHRCMQQLIHKTGNDDKPTVREFWKSFNIKKSVENINLSWKEVTPLTMNSVWEKILSQCVIGDDLQNSVLQIQKDIVKLAQDVGFKEVDEDQQQNEGNSIYKGL